VRSGSTWPTTDRLGSWRGHTRTAVTIPAVASTARVTHVVVMPAAAASHPAIG
jgi:hypothetical protein